MHFQSKPTQTNKLLVLNKENTSLSEFHKRFFNSKIGHNLPYIYFDIFLFMALVKDELKNIICSLKSNHEIHLIDIFYFCHHALSTCRIKTSRTKTINLVKASKSGSHGNKQNSILQGYQHLRAPLSELL